MSYSKYSENSAQKPLLRSSDPQISDKDIPSLREGLNPSFDQSPNGSRQKQPSMHHSPDMSLAMYRIRPNNEAIIAARIKELELCLSRRTCYTSWLICTIILSAIGLSCIIPLAVTGVSSWYDYTNVLFFCPCLGFVIAICQGWLEISAIKNQSILKAKLAIILMMINALILISLIVFVCIEFLSGGEIPRDDLQRLYGVVNLYGIVILGILSFALLLHLLITLLNAIKVRSILVQLRTQRKLLEISDED